MRSNTPQEHPARKTGALLIEEGLARKVDIEAALKIQQQEAAEIDISKASNTDFPTDTDTAVLEAVSREKNSKRTIGQILCDLDLITPVDLSRVMLKYKKQLRLGEFLLREGIIDAEQLEAALYEQQQRLQPLGHIMVKQNRISIDQLYEALAKQYSIPYKRLDGFEFGDSQKERLIRIVGRNYAEQNLILPLSLEGTKLTLATCIPDKIANIHKIGAVCATLRIDCVLIRAETFQTLFIDLYGSPADGMVDAVEAARPPRAGGDASGKADAGKSITRQPDADALEMVNTIIKYGIQTNASSIHMEQELDSPRIRYRIDGVLQALKHPWSEEKLADLTDEVISTLKRMAGLNVSERRIPQNGIFNVRYYSKQKAQPVDFDFRAYTCPTIAGENITLLISGSHRTDAGFETQHLSFHVLRLFKKALQESNGVILVTGPVGNGKAALLYAAVSHLSRPGKKMISLEEPVQRTLPGVMQTQVDAGLNLSCATMLRSLLNHDPDVILVSEIRDRDTARAAFEISQAGPLILSGFVAEDCVNTLFALVDLDIHPKQIARSLKGVLSQRRVRKICRICKEKYVPIPDQWQPLFEIYPTGISFFRGKGCKACRFTGYDGTLCISEIVLINGEIAGALRNGADEKVMRQIVFESGVKTMMEDALLKLNFTTLDEIIRVVPKPARRSEDDSPAGSVKTEKLATSNGPGPIILRNQTWTISSPESDIPVIDEMHGIYRSLKRPDGKRSTPTEAPLFHAFIKQSYNRICREYGCDHVLFRIENRQGRPEISATPGRTVQADD